MRPIAKIRCGVIETLLLAIRSILQGAMSRTADNCLKMAALISASRQDPSIDGRITVTEEDVAHAVYFVQNWVPYTMEVVPNAGVSDAEQLVQRVLAGINREPGVSRSKLMIETAETMDISEALV